jgi:hypothetical protein
MLNGITYTTLDDDPTDQPAKKVRTSQNFPLN